MDCIGTCGLGVKITNSDPEGRYSIEKQIIGDPHLSCLLVHTKFNVAPEWQGRLHLYRALRSPHADRRMAQQRSGGKARGRKFLMAYRDECLSWPSAATAHFSKLSCGYVGVNDGWTDFSTTSKWIGSTMPRWMAISP